ncbi:putative transposon Ty3-I Gag-Pol polyprotein [Clavispora lusitaniae]|uniref:Transposon Ty3-I Gag-Pol polyprotein n=3 Tax=Clavispora lusitaniae TaxID=36911 RepID=A0ACD0WDS9_CLALS|nr:putative transposon Ty3-I Gag-Pol polyprotein [Clavispora lusitaniae]QFZ25707.1 putative transposon Ty3-I Gag-Pol polyprotein [Clavispora lusitaniae]QFZ26746.1 putative transposon Ty3-I Gag-Pol polyprotein [Clavispora lusitaniae]QFZ30990.1 putative transposon Ty3-I Gag-Pol polyprotein [Clavispora lusitaniae]QFZ31277.1 putative transposon Ty3-I Gag-Pol polyprotein [Clavispora lusitaniae]
MEVAPYQPPADHPAFYRRFDWRTLAPGVVVFSFFLRFLSLRDFAHLAAQTIASRLLTHSYHEFLSSYLTGYSTQYLEGVQNPLALPAQASLHILQDRGYAPTNSWLEQILLILSATYVSKSLVYIFAHIAWMVIVLNLLQTALQWIRPSSSPRKPREHVQHVHIEGLDRFIDTVHLAFTDPHSHSRSVQPSLPRPIQLFFWPFNILFAPFVLVFNTVRWFINTILACVGFCFQIPCYFCRIIVSTITRFIPWRTPSAAPAYKLRQLDFSSRPALLASLVPQIRLRPFDASALHDALCHAGHAAHWTDLREFRRAHSRVLNFTTATPFLRWFLRWNLSTELYQQYMSDHTNQALALVTPATSYNEVVAVLRQLDSLCYINDKFTSVFQKLITTGALSRPRSLSSTLRTVLAKYPTYFEFFAVLDYKWWYLCPDLRGKPQQRPRHIHFLRNGKSSTRQVRPRRAYPEIQAALVEHTPEASLDSYYSTVHILPHNHTTIAYWDQGSVCSVISPALVTELNLHTYASGQPRHFQLIGSGTHHFIEQKATVTFTIPGLTHEFTFDFTVFDSKVGPIVLGLDFWTKYAILCQPGRRFEFEGTSIPVISHVVNPLDFQDDDPIEEIDELPPDFQTMLDTFKATPPALTLPPQRPDDYRIRIKPEARRAKNRPLPKYTLAASQFLIEEVQRLLQIGFIEPSVENDFVVPQLVPKKTGGYRIVFDYRSVNDITDAQPTTLASFRSLMPGLTHANVFSSLDLTSGYHQLRIHPATIPYTAFNTPIGRFQWKVLPFGLCDAPHVFGSYMTALLRDHAAYCRVYLDDILIFSPDAESHLHHVRSILDLLSQNHHTVNWDKCVFHRSSIEWVGHQISSKGIAATDTSVGQIQKLGAPESKSDIKAFLGHVGYLQDMIPNFAHRAQPLTDLLAKGAHFNWSTRCQTAFLDLKNAVLSIVPVQAFDPHAPIQVHTDASHFAASAVLLQPSRTNPKKWYPIEYRSKKFDVHQRNWDIHVKEFWAIMFAFRKFRFFLEGHFFTLYCDQKSIPQIFEQYANPARTTEPIDPRLQRWMSRILYFRFHMEHHPGTQNVLADHLSRNPAYAPAITALGAIVELDADPSWLDSFRGAYATDPFFGPPYARLTDSSTSPVSDDHYRFDPVTELLYYDDRLCVPRAVLEQFLFQTHAAVSAGHPGVRRWLQAISPHYYFPDMTATLTHYVQGCSTCQRHKYRSQRPAGLLQPSDPPRGRWTDIATDLITGLPDATYQSRSVNAVLTIVDKFSNRTHFYAVSSKFGTSDLVNILLESYFPLHGLPRSIQSDRGPQFTSAAFQTLMSQLNVDSQLSLARHQQSDGRVENRNKLIETYLRLYVASNPEWPKFLSLGEFALNSSPSTSFGGCSPFELDLGYVPSAPTQFSFPLSSSATNRYTEDLTEVLDRMATTADAARQSAFESAKSYFDKKHSGVTFEAGAEVYIDTTHLAHHPDAHNAVLAPKLRSKFSGPFTITEVLSPVNYRLAMPTSFKGNPVFHINSLRLKKSVPHQFFTPAPAEVPVKRYKDGSTLVEISEILSHRKLGRGYRLSARCAPSKEYPQGEVAEFRASALARTAHDLLKAYATKHRLPQILELCSNLSDEAGGDVRSTIPGNSGVSQLPVMVPTR